MLEAAGYGHFVSGEKMYVTNILISKLPPARLGDRVAYAVWQFAGFGKPGITSPVI